MKGVYGAMLIALGVFVAIMGGYILNAETVTTCSTDWSYVTDVNAAFVGDRSDMDVDYSPPANVTGWSYSKGYNNGWISGVEYTESGRVNGYGAYAGSSSQATYSATISTADYDGSMGSKRFAVQYSDGGPMTEAAMPSEWGLRNSMAVTVFTMDGHADVQGAFAAPLSALTSILPAYSEAATATIQVQAPSDGYPCIAVVDQSVSRGEFQLGSLYYEGAIATKTARTTGVTAEIVAAENAAIVGGVRYPLSDVLLVWGTAQANGGGAHSDSMTVSLVVETPEGRVYVDPAFGIVAVPGTYVEREVEYTDHPGSSTCSLEVSLSRPSGMALATASGTVGATASGAGTAIVEWDFVAAANGITHTIVRMAADQSVSVDSESSDGQGTILVEIASGTATVTVNGSVLGTQALAGSEVSELSGQVTFPNGGYTHADVAITGERQDGSSDSVTGGGSWSIPMSYRSVQATETVHSYQSAYWENGYQNSAVTIAFQCDSAATAVTEVYLTSAGQTGIVQSTEIHHDPSSGWTVWYWTGAAYDTLYMGKWPAIEVTATPTSIAARPLGAFTSFLDYTVINVEQSASADIADGKPIQRMHVYGDAAMPMMVVSTVTRISEGGLYLRDATLDVRTAFPESQAVSLTFKSAARTGDSITIAGSGTPVTLAVQGDRIQIGTDWYDLEGMTFRWYSISGASATIGGTVYGPGIYESGQLYAAGKVYAQPLHGDLIVVTPAASGFSITLDGVWAPAVAMYEGTNEASQKTELMDFTHGIFRWDKEDFLIVMMGVCVLGGVVGGYFKLAGLADWAVIMGAVGVMWMVL